MAEDLLQRFRDDGWVQRPNGRWMRTGEPTECWAGHPYVPRSHILGWDGSRIYRWCLHPDHGEDHGSRWLFTTGAQEPAQIERGAANGEVSTAKRT